MLCQLVGTHTHCVANKTQIIIVNHPSSMRACKVTSKQAVNEAGQVCSLCNFLLKFFINEQRCREFITQRAHIVTQYCRDERRLYGT